MTSTTTPTRLRWQLRTADLSTIQSLARTHSVPETVGRLLVARGITSREEVERHLDPRLTALHDPALLPGMEAATARIARAIESRETILVHGDYDVDGVTGTALLMRLFKLLGARAAWHIPNRFTDGYSFGDHSVAKAKSTGATLVISVDNGTSAVETIEKLRAAGVDTIVTDHHEPPRGELPCATAIVNPKLAGSSYPFRDLCGGAVAFKLAWGVCQKLSNGDRVRPQLREFLVEAMSYVAIATVCDVVPLVDENRILARFGLRSLEMSKNPGLVALMAVAKLSKTHLEGDDVAFKIGPRINASGRLGSAALAVELLLAENEHDAARLAHELDELNVERKRIEGDLLQIALSEAEPYADRELHPVLVLAGQGWHQGVIGIIAARLVDRFERPAIVIGLDGESGRGSARSVPGFSVLEVLHAGAPHLVHYGGHEQAAGLEIRAEHVELLREALCIRARTMLRDSRVTVAPLWIDCDLPFQHMTPELMRELDRLRPFGEKNEKPTLFSADLRLAEPPRIVGSDRTHVMLQLRLGAHVMKAMAFGMAHRSAELRMGEPLHAVYTPRWNTFRGATNLELELVDFCTGPKPLI